jgi:hypothetical protein
MKQHNIFLFVLLLAIGFSGSLHAQDSSSFRFYLTMTDSGAGTLTFKSARFGWHPDAQFGYDGTGRTPPFIHQYALHGFVDRWFPGDTDSSAELDGFPNCAFTTEVRLNNDRAPRLESAEGQYVDIHPIQYPGQTDTFKVTWCPNDGLQAGSYRPQIFTWPSPNLSYIQSMKLVLFEESPRKTIDMLQQSSWTMYPWVDTDILGNPIRHGLIIVTHGPSGHGAPSVAGYGLAILFLLLLASSAWVIRRRVKT